MKYFKLFFDLNRPITYNLGNLLMIIAVFIIIFIYAPFVSLYLFPQQINVQKLEHSKGYYIYIPKINAESPIITNVDPWNQTTYLKALHSGVAQALGTALPGQPGTSYLFAHSSDYPWDITRYNIAFFRLGELHLNDQILIFMNGKKLTYHVFAIKTVWPTETQYLKPSKVNQLILQTCTPVGTSFMRLLVFAKLY